MNRLVVGLLVGNICLSLGTLLPQAYGQSLSGAGTRSAETMVMVVFATQNIERGQVIGASVLEARQMDAARRPADAVNTVKDAVGKVAKYGIVKGQLVCTHDLQAR